MDSERASVWGLEWGRGENGEQLPAHPAALLASLSHARARTQNELRAESHVAQPLWREVFSHGRAIVIGTGLMLMSALTGINAVIFYSTTIFELAGFDSPLLGTVSAHARGCVSVWCVSDES